MNPIITQLSFQEQEVLWRCSSACETLPICVYLTYVVIAAYNHSKAWGATSSCLLLRQRSFWSHVVRSKIEHGTRRCHHPWCSHDRHCSGVEGYARWEAPLSRSDWARNPQSGAAAQQLNHRRSWGTELSKVLGWWIPSDRCIWKKRSGGCSATWHLYTGMFCGEDSLQRDKYFRGCLPKLTSASFAHNPWVCEPHWILCLSRLHLFGEYYFGWVCGSHWILCLSRLHLFDEHYLGWLCDSHWDLCLWKLQFSSEHHFGWLCDSHWGWSLSRLHLSGEHHFGWLCDSHWGPCLSRLHLSSEHHFGWLCDSHWGWSLSRLHLSGEHHFGWLCDSHWGPCLSRLHLSSEHHFGWLCDSHWGWSLSRLHLSGEHHFGWLCDSHWGPCLSRLHLSCEHHFGWVCDLRWDFCFWWLHLFSEHHNARVSGRHVGLVRGQFRGNHNHSCKGEKETTTEWVSERADLSWPCGLVGTTSTACRKIVAYSGI